MSVLIVGADYIKSIENLLVEKGHKKITHWPSRNNSDCHKKIPADTELIVVLTNYLNHGMARHVRKIASERRLPVIYARRSIAELDFALNSQKVSYEYAA